MDSWKNETLQELLLAKNEVKKSVPVLSTVGAQAIYWEKQIITSMPTLQSAAPQRLTYQQVNTMNRNKEAQRYKRRIRPH